MSVTLSARASYPWTARWKNHQFLLPCEAALLRRVAKANRRCGESTGKALRRLMESCSISKEAGLAIGFNDTVDIFYNVYRTSGAVTVEWNMPRERRLWLESQRDKALAYYTQLGLVERY
jgi:hypothetical protein